MVYQHDGLLNAIGGIGLSLQTGVLQQYNAILSFNKFVGQNITDDWGNVIPGTPVIQNLYCKLNKVKPPNVDEEQGLNHIRIYFTGYLINPLTYSPIPKKVDAQISYNNILYKGDFYVNISVMSALAEAVEITQYTGQRIEGYFQIHEGDI